MSDASKIKGLLPEPDPKTMSFSGLLVELLHLRDTGGENNLRSNALRAEMDQRCPPKP
jgi:hypothetical protein